MKRKRKISGKLNADYINDNRRKSSILFNSKQKTIKSPIKTNKSNSKNKSFSKLDNSSNNLAGIITIKKKKK